MVAVVVNIILELVELVPEVLEVVVMEVIQLILFPEELLIQVVAVVVGLVTLLLSKTLEVEEELVVIDVPYRVKVLVVVHQLNQL